MLSSPNYVDGALEMKDKNVYNSEEIHLFGTFSCVHHLTILSI